MNICKVIVIFGAICVIASTIKKVYTDIDDDFLEEQ